MAEGKFICIMHIAYRKHCKPARPLLIA